jgi:GDP-4-dehydro-6-deoxy-D-mannose reductase
VQALVTGAAGFVGQWLCRALLADGWTVTGVSLEGTPQRGTLTPRERAAVRFEAVDLRDGALLPPLLDRVRPDAVFHLAGVALVPAASAAPAVAWGANVLPAVELMGALATRVAAGTLDPVVVVAGSAEQYGAHPVEAHPLREETGLRPLSVYAATKVAQEVAVLQAHRASGIRAVLTRPFNHSGPGQAPAFLLPALVQRALAAQASGAVHLPLGNVTPIRDFSHVADVVAAYVALAGHGTPGEVYNIASGTGWSVGELAALVCERVGVSARLLPDPDLQRSVDVPMLVGDPTKLRAATSWAPTHDVPAIIDDLINASTD